MALRQGAQEAASAGPSAASALDTSRISPYFLDEWCDSVCRKWGLKSLKLSLTLPGKELPRLDTVLYLDKRGRIVQPSLNPHLPVAFWPSQVKGNAKRYSQWQRLSAQLADEFQLRGVRGVVCLSSEAVDVREWQWRGFDARVRYTFIVHLPLNRAMLASNVRNKISKATRAGFVCERVDIDDLTDLVECVRATQERQGFDHLVTLDDARGAMALLGPDSLRVYACREPEQGKVVALQAALYGGGWAAKCVMASTHCAFLQTGVTQLLTAFKLDDLAAQGAKEYDYVGANLPTVSAAKQGWGGKLVPYYALSRPGRSHTAYRRVRRAGGRILRRCGLR